MFTNGLNTLTNLNTTGAFDQAFFLLFSTHGAGQITQWEIILQEVGVAEFETFSSISGGPPSDETWIGNPGTTPEGRVLGGHRCWSLWALGPKNPDNPNDPRARELPAAQHRLTRPWDNAPAPKASRVV